MTGAAVTGVCQLRDMVARRNLIIAQECRRERGGVGFSPHRKPLPRSPEVICQVWPALGPTGKQVGSSQVHRHAWLWKSPYS